MNTPKFESPNDFLPFEAFPQKQRAFLIAKLAEQFTTEAANQLYDAGSLEEDGPLLPAPTPENDPAGFKVELVRSATADWAYFSCTPPCCDALLQSVVCILRSRTEPPGSVVPLARRDGFLLRHERLRIVYRRRSGEGRIVIYAIGERGINPLTKVWRYFDQNKALDLICSKKLYLRRLDLLTHQFEGDPYEGTPTFHMLEVYKRVYRQYVSPADDAELIKRFEQERRATFVSCWQRSESESWLMWKQYCQRGGGFAVQTTLRRLNHLFAARVEEYGTLILRPVVYIDHWSDDPLPHRVPVQVFYKPTWFSEEREIRLVRFRHECAGAGTVEQCEQALSRLDDHDYIPACTGIIWWFFIGWDRGLIHLGGRRYRS